MNGGSVNPVHDETLLPTVFYWRQIRVVPYVCVYVII